jgi:hypothetical protein
MERILAFHFEPKEYTSTHPTHRSTAGFESTALLSSTKTTKKFTNGGWWHSHPRSPTYTFEALSSHGVWTDYVLVVVEVRYWKDGEGTYQHICYEKSPQ